MADDDIFGDASLFAEFNKEREEQTIFINYEQDDTGLENRSRIVFKDAESDYEESDEDIESQVNSTQNASQADESVFEPEPTSDSNQNCHQSTSFQEQFESILFRRLI